MHHLRSGSDRKKTIVLWIVAAGMTVIVILYIVLFTIGLKLSGAL